MDAQVWDMRRGLFDSILSADEIICSHHYDWTIFQDAKQKLNITFSPQSQSTDISYIQTISRSRRDGESVWLLQFIEQFKSY